MKHDIQRVIETVQRVGGALRVTWKSETIDESRDVCIGQDSSCSMRARCQSWRHCW